MILVVTDMQIADLYHRRWVPDLKGHLHGPTVWATWDGQGAHFGVQPDAPGPADELKQLDPEFAAFVMVLDLPPAAEIAAHGMAAFGRWLAAGLPVVTTEQRDERGAICGPCGFWDAQAHFGLGMCRHSACGCTRLKWWLKTERCPAGLWPEVA